ncbi:MAG: hypothetical protein HXX15_13125 [Rhodopseudomonas sp.]|uniref:hypothetical protein n=1 Tax=Rhodopseudomonas sp. TaxID=1078 RepID=UPI001798D27F|nr:hypothetical protein [Rhodopseudomonas sp.]NVN87016.1 hypothetical protein [Rhodopseudomonas sp.]
MPRIVPLAAALVLLAGTFGVTVIDAASARGGAANLMNSPGYQRRLQESRQQLAAPEPRSPRVHHGKVRHRRH